MRTRSLLTVLSGVLLALSSACGAGLAHAASDPAPASATVVASSPASDPNGGVQHLEYVLPDQTLYVYDIDHGFKLVKQISMPAVQGARGIAASPKTNRLYISYGGDGNPTGNGALLAYDLGSDQVIWTRSYQHGVDSMDISPDGKTIYLPSGELTSDRNWYVIDAATGDQTGVIQAGLNPHNTVVGLSGKNVYMGGRRDNYLYVADTATNKVRQVGPLKQDIRPFTINGAETLAFTTASGFLGFQVSDLSSGKLLYTVPIQGFSYTPSSDAPSTPSHGISLSPNEQELYVMDQPNDSVHVFDVSGLPASPPKQVASIHLQGSMTGNVSPCIYDCQREGWLQHSADGHYVFVGDAGDVIDTTTRQTVAVLPSLENTKKFIEIDFQNGHAISTTSRIGLGHVAATG